MPSPLPRDATLSNLRLSSKELEAFVRRVIGIMRAAQRENGKIFMRIGTTGTGIAPNYRFEKPDGDLVGAIDGANHQPWPLDTRFDGRETWSTAHMTYEDVEQLLASITGYKPKV